MRNWFRLAVLVLVAVALAGFIARHVRGTAAVPAGVPAPPLELSDTEGRVVSLSALRGKVVAINFWASWCGPCRQEIPDLAELYAAHRGQCFELLGVAEESGGHDEVVAAARKLGVTYPVLIDRDQKAEEAFRVPGYPRTYLIDVDGRVRTVIRGSVDRAELERVLAPLLAEAPAACPRA